MTPPAPEGEWQPDARLALDTEPDAGPWNTGLDGINLAEREA